MRGLFAFGSAMLVVNKQSQILTIHRHRLGCTTHSDAKCFDFLLFENMILSVDKQVGLGWTNPFRKRANLHSRVLNTIKFKVRAKSKLTARAKSSNRGR